VSKIRVLVIDDSALVRKMLSTMLSSDPGIEVVGTAADPLVAREKIKELNPDVLTLDVEMPHMDGVTFLENLMRLRPMPVVMVSTLTANGADVTLRALELGAVDFVSKPGTDLSGRFDAYAEEIIGKVKAAARCRPRALNRPLPAPQPKLTADAVLPAPGAATRLLPAATTVIAIGSSAGGTEAVRELLSAMPPDAPPVVVTQHIPAQFSGPWAARLDAASAMRVAEAKDGQPLMPGHVYVAPGGVHLLVVRDGARYICRLHDGPPVTRHKPSVDVLFRSVARAVGNGAIGVILTGMGDDGAQGLKEMRDAGAHTIGQDEATCVVWGMPHAALVAGGVVEELPLESIAPKLVTLARNAKRQ
jgi:two-component system chemotaxis response regulator CheB